MLVKSKNPDKIPGGKRMLMPNADGMALWALAGVTPEKGKHLPIEQVEGTQLELQVRSDGQGGFKHALVGNSFPNVTWEVSRVKDQIFLKPVAIAGWVKDAGVPPKVARVKKPLPAIRGLGAELTLTSFQPIVHDFETPRSDRVQGTTQAKIERESAHEDRVCAMYPAPEFSVNRGNSGRDWTVYTAAGVLVAYIEGKPDLNAPLSPAQSALVREAEKQGVPYVLITDTGFTYVYAKNLVPTGHSYVRLEEQPVNA
jgi:hypothetical protein